MFVLADPWPPTSAPSQQFPFPCAAYFLSAPSQQYRSLDIAFRWYTSSSECPHTVESPKRLDFQKNSNSIHRNETKTTPNNNGNKKKEPINKGLELPPENQRAQNLRETRSFFLFSSFYHTIHVLTFPNPKTKPETQWIAKIINAVTTGNPI